MKKNLGAASVVFPTPVYIVGTYNEDGTPNAMNVAWGGLCSSEPPCVMIAIRHERLTYENIMRTGEFTVNIPDATHVKEADYLGLISGKKLNKIEAAGLTVEKGTAVNAPVINEFPYALECKCIKKEEVGQHMLIVGEILETKADESCLNEKGNIDIKKVDPMAYDPAGNQYMAVNQVVDKAFSAGIELLPK